MTVRLFDCSARLLARAFQASGGSRPLPLVVPAILCCGRKRKRFDLSLRGCTVRAGKRWRAFQPRFRPLLTYLNEFRGEAVGRLSVNNFAPAASGRSDRNDGRTLHEKHKIARPQPVCIRACSIFTER